MRIKLSGWQRLWLLTSVIFVAAVALESYATFPSWATLDNDSLYERLDPEQRALTVSFHESTNGEAVGANLTFPGGKLLRVKPNVNDVQKLALAKAFARIANTELADQRESLVLRAASVALFSCAFVYTLGWGIAWVRRGFRAG